MKKLLNTILIAGVLSACSNDDNGGGTLPPQPEPLDPLRRISFSFDGSVENGDSDGILPYAVSGDGRYVTFTSAASNLLAKDADTILDVYMYDAQLNQLRLVSVNNDQLKGDDLSISDMVSVSGRYVTFTTRSSLLLNGQQTDRVQLILRDTETDTIEILSKNAADELGNSSSFAGMMSKDERYLVFASEATNLVPNDSTDNFSDIYRLDRNSGEVIKITHPISGTSIDGRCRFPGISPDGRYIVFDSAASNLVDNDTNDATDVFIYDTEMDTFKRISEGNGNSTGVAPIISNDGNFVVFIGLQALIDGDPSGNSGVYMYTISSGEMSLVSLAEDGRVISNVWAHSVNGDGRYVAFSSADDSIVEGDSNGSFDIFINDTVAGETMQLEIGGVGLDQESRISMSADGRYIVTFTTKALTADDENGLRDVYRAPNPFLVQ